METEKVKNKYELVTKTNNKWTWYRKLVPRQHSGLVGEVTIQVPLTDKQVSWLQNNDERFKDAISPKRMSFIIANALKMPEELYTEVETKKSDLVIGFQEQILEAIATRKEKQLPKHEIRSQIARQLEALYPSKLEFTEYNGLVDFLDAQLENVEPKKAKILIM